ncbi:MAG TPA: GDSL-type esterase/lipase family protein [Bacteroidia bacterium]
MKRIIGIALCVLTIAGFAQDTTKYPFINYGASKLIFSKDSSNMLGFYKKLDDLKKGDRKRVSIVHIGGSHIQAGFWSESIHDQFQELGNYEGGGMFAFPFKLGKTNGPHSYKTSSNGTWKRCRCIQKEKCTPLGVSGIAVVSNDSANYFALKIQPNKHLKNFTKIKIYHNFNKSFLFSLRREVPVPYKRFDNEKEGYTQYIFDNPVDSVCFDMLRKDTLVKDFALFGFSLENDNPGVYYASMGVNGASTESFLRCENFVTQLKTLQPDLVIFSLGVNDVHGPNFRASDYMAHYDSLVTFVKQAAPDCAILFTTISDNYIRKKTPNKKTMLGDDAILELAEKRNLAVWDLFTVMGGYKSIYKWQKAKLAGRDRVHFSGKGYKIIASLMFDAIMRSYKANSTLNK